MSKERKVAIRFADKWFSLFIRARDKFCYTCGTRRNLECGHLFPRTFLGTRWHEAAAFAQCHNCNSLHESDTEPFYGKFINDNGLELFEYLQRLTRSPVLKTDHEIRYIGEKYKHRYEQLNRGNWNG